MPNPVKTPLIRLPTLTIALPAFNEEKTIVSLLDTLVRQKHRNFQLLGITVYSDQSTDRTDARVLAFAKKHPQVSLKIGTTRLGKYYRLNEAFKHCPSDVLIILDADIAITDPYFLEKMVDATLADKKIHLVSAHQLLVRPSGIIARTIYTYFHLGDCIRWSLPDLNGGVNFFASATAYSGIFARSFKIPVGLTDPHLYLYLSAAKNQGTSYCRTAVIYQQPISTWIDFKKFLRRPLGKPDPEVERIFNTTSAQVYAIPRRYKLIGFLKCFKDEPLYTLPALGLDLYSKLYLSFFHYRSKSSLWEIVSSTKKPI